MHALPLKRPSGLHGSHNSLPDGRNSNGL
jgi:hypothetical protein